jgi:hypothetical protein
MILTGSSTYGWKSSGTPHAHASVGMAPETY